MKKIAIILSGCGVFDGSEIYESVVTFMALEKIGASYQCFAPDVAQAKVINHITQETMSETRNVLIESARLARGNIKNMLEANADDFDALILPGGFGAASNLCDFAEKGNACEVNPEVAKFINAFKVAKKPVGFICITPAILAKIYGDGVKCTIGNDQQTAQMLEKMGAHHVACPVDEIVVDEIHNVITTPAFMLGQNITEVAAGIEKLVNAIIKRV